MSQEDTPAHTCLAASQAELLSDQPALASPGYVDCLRHCLRGRGDDYPKPYIMGICGETFRFLYDQTDPERGLSVVAHNPLRAGASALGYDSEIYCQPELEPALDLLWEQLQGGPAIMHLGEQWAVVARAPEGRPAFTVAMPGQESADWERPTLAAAWQREPGLLELGLPGYYFFQLGEKQREPDYRDASLGSLRRGIRLMMRQAKVNGCAAGLAAYEDLQRAFRRPRRDPRQWRMELDKFLRWRALPVAYAVGSRQAASRYLALVEEHFEEETRQHLRKAASKYERVAGMLARLPELPAELVPPLDRASNEPFTPEERRAMRAFSGIRRRAARCFKKAHRLEQEALDDLRRVLDSVERQKKP